MKLHIAVNYDRNDGDNGFANFLFDDCPGPPMTAETIGWVREKLMSGGIRDCRAVVILNWQYLEVPDRGVGNSSEMVERVAQAVKKRAKEPVGNVPSLEPVLVGSLGDAWPYLIKAALIEMREPTEAMLKAGTEAIDFDCAGLRRLVAWGEYPADAPGPNGETSAIADLVDAWRAMIDAALEKRG